MADKKVLITGGAGFIGSHTVDALIERGYRVRVYDNLVEQVHGPDRKIPSFLHPEAEFILGDICDRDGLSRALRGIDIVFHEAAEVGVGQSMYSIDRYISTNVRGTGILWDILVNEKHQVEKVMVASSMSLYGEGRYHCQNHGDISPKNRAESDLKNDFWEMKCPQCDSVLSPIPTDENKELDCQSVYAQSKKDQEVYSLMLGEAYKIPTIACRYFNCYGPRQSLNNPYTGAAAIFSSSIKNRKPPLIYEDGLQKRDFIHVKDLVRAKLMLLEDQSIENGIFNIGTGRPTSILELAETLISLYGENLQPNVIRKFRNGDIRHCYADTSKIQSMGFLPEISLAEGLKDVTEWGGNEESESRAHEVHQVLLDKGLVG